MSASLPASRWRSHGLLLLLALMYADNFVGRQIVAVMIEPIKQEFGASDTSMGLISGLAFAAVFALLGLPAGRVADRSSRTRLLAGSCLLWGIATVLCGLAGSFLLLVFARMAVAAAEAPSASAAMSLIADLYPPQRRAFAISCFTAAPTFAAILALSAGAWLVAAQGWRMSFVIVGVPALLLAALLAFVVKEPQRGIWDAAAHAAPRLSLGATLASLWAQRAFRRLVLASALATLGGNAFGMWNATFLVRSYGLELQHAGLLAGIVGGTAAGVGVLFSGWLSDRLGHRDPRWRVRIPLVGHAVGAASLAAYLLWPADLLATLSGVPIPAAMIWCAINGFFVVWWMAPSFSMLTSLVPAESRAVALACQAMLSTLLGVGAGPVITGLLSDLLHPVFGLEALRYALSFSCLSALCAVALLAHLHVSPESSPCPTLPESPVAPCNGKVQSSLLL